MDPNSSAASRSISTIESDLARLLEAEGAAAFGVAEATEVDAEEWARFERWLAAGWHAGMDYMERHRDIRRDPRLLLEGARSIISVAFNYRQPNPYPEYACYSLGDDYHKVIRRRLKRVVRELKERYGGDWRICVDTAPILERYWAVKAGVGRRNSLHGNVTVPGVGSMVFLAEILTTLELPLTGELPATASASGPSPCPTGALQEGGVIDARRCINYLTIEHKGEFTAEERALLALPGAADRVFGCDICQLADPVNRPATASTDWPAVIEELRATDRKPCGHRR